MDQLQNLTNPQPVEDGDVKTGLLKKIGNVKLGLLSFASLVLVGGGVYAVTTAFGDASEPPVLELNTSTMAQGMAKTSVKEIPGFAKFTAEDEKAYKCNPKFEVTLGNRITNLFAKEKVTLKEIAAAIRPTKGSQYLIAFYEPAKEDVKRAKNTYYLYPTESSPFKSNESMDVLGTLNGDFEIPAYRGFQIITDNPDTLFCKASLYKTSTDGVWYTSDGKEISFEQSVKILKSMRVLPKGWVMIPAGNNTSIIGGFFDLMGKDIIDAAYYQADTGEFKKFDYAKDWNSSAETGAKLKYNTVWFHLKDKVNLAYIVDEILAQMEEAAGVKEEPKKAKKAEKTENVDTTSASDVDVAGTADSAEAADTANTAEISANEFSDDGTSTDATADTETDVNCETNYDPNNPLCNPVDAGEGGCEGEECTGEEGESFYDGNSMQMMTDEFGAKSSNDIGSSFEVEGVYLFNVNELAICFNRPLGNIPAGITPSDVFGITRLYDEFGVGISGWGNGSYSSCDNYLSVVINPSEFTSGYNYLLTIRDLNDYSFEFQI